MTCHKPSPRWPAVDVLSHGLYCLCVYINQREGEFFLNRLRELSYAFGTPTYLYKFPKRQKTFSYITSGQSSKSKCLYWHQLIYRWHSDFNSCPNNPFYKKRKCWMRSWIQLSCLFSRLYSGLWTGSSVSLWWLQLLTSTSWWFCTPPAVGVCLMSLEFNSGCAFPARTPSGVHFPKIREDTPC